MSLPPRLDFKSNTYLTLYLSQASPHLFDPSSITAIHPGLSHIGPVGTLRDVQLFSVSKEDWQSYSDQILAFLKEQPGITRVEVQRDPNVRMKRGAEAENPQHAELMTFSSLPKFLVNLKSLYPASSHSNPWYIIAAVGFAASNRPEAIPDVFRNVMKEMEGSKQDEKLLVVRRMRDAIFKAGLVNGYPKEINGLKALFDVTPEELRDSDMSRDTSRSISQLEKQGRAAFKQTYGETADSTESLLSSIYPDLGWFSIVLGYGFVYSFEGVLSAKEMSFALSTALIASAVPRQVRWHVNGARRKGATLEEVRAVRSMAIKIAEECGVVWREKVPEVDENI